MTHPPTKLITPLRVAHPAKQKTFLAYSETHVNYTNYQNMINSIVSSGITPETSVLFNGDFCTYWDEHKQFWVGNTATIEQQHLHFLKTFTSNSINPRMLRIFNLGNHEFLGGNNYSEDSRYWREFVNAFDQKKFQAKIYI
jgi:hypothetical protein